MIRQHDYQQIVPLWGLFHVVDKVADAFVQIIEGIGYLIVQTVCGHIPWLMTAECGVADEEWTLLRFHHLPQCCESDIVAHTPFRGLLFLSGVVFHPM